MNADLSKIHLLRSIRSGNNESTFSLARDIQELEYAAMTLGDCKLIVIDPVTSYLQGAAWTNAVMIRTVLDPLKALAERTGAAVILVNHLTKTKSAAMYRSLGSISIVGMCRVAWIFTRDMSDPERRLMLPLKNNLVASRKNLSYKITNRGIEWEADPFQLQDDLISRLDFHEREAKALDKAMSWLSMELFGKEILSTTIEREAQKRGISPRTLRRAREKLKVMTRPIGQQGSWLWRL
jgi:RecA-family ATPase